MNANVESVPAWVRDAIFYQIFPDRFARADEKASHPYYQPWGSKPTLRGFQGGDLQGILRRLDYLLELGVTAIYLNPIFLASSNHRYNTTDYYRIDPKLGTMADFRRLVDAVHANGMRIILDGVFNHVGRGFFAFNDLLENQEDSPYRDWFFVHRFPVDAYSPGPAESYAAWWGYKSLPKLNTNNPDVRRFLLDVARYWIEQGADGWRLDVPNEIDDDTFWAEFRAVVRSVNPEAYLVGEIWNVDPRWVGPGHFDGLMNYPLRREIIHLVCGKIRPGSFCRRVEDILSAYPLENQFAFYNLLGSHDRERIATLLDGDIARVKLAHLILFALPGAPGIYYGDEIGIRGGKDPDCRGAFPWDLAQWDHDLRSFLRRLIAVRKGSTALRHGSFSMLKPVHKHVLGFLRQTQEDQVLVIANPESVEQTVRFRYDDFGWPIERDVTDLCDSVNVIRSGDEFEVCLPPFSGGYLTLRP